MYAEGTKRQGLLLGFGGFTGPQIESAAHRLANVIERSSKKRGTPKRCDGRAGASQKDEGAHRTTWRALLHEPLGDSTAGAVPFWPRRNTKGTGWAWGSGDDPRRFSKTDGIAWFGRAAADWIHWT